MAESRAAAAGMSDLAGGKRPPADEAAPTVGTATRVSGGQIPNIHNLTQVLIKSLESVEQHVDTLNRSISEMMTGISTSMEQVSRDIIESNRDTTMAAQEATRETVDSVKDMTVKSEKSLMQMARSSKRIIQGFVGGVIYGVLIKGIIDGIKAVTQAIEFNLFGWLEDRAKNLFSMLTEHIVGLNDALQSFRAGQQSAVEWQQSFGISVQLSRELQNTARANANEFINYTQYIQAYQAAMAGGIRDNALIQQVGNLLAMTSQATGADTGMLGQLATKMIYEFGMDTSGVEGWFDTINRFNQGLASRGIRGISTGTYYENLLSRQGKLLELQGQGADINNLMQSSMLADAFSGAAGLDSNFMWNLLAQGMTSDSAAGVLGVASPQEVQQAIMSGNIAPLMQGITQFVGGLYTDSGGDLQLVSQHLSEALNVTYEDALRLATALGPNGDGLTAITEILGQALDKSIGTGLNESAQANITPLTQIKNTMEAFARNLSIGGVSMLDIVTNLEEIMPYIETMTGGIDLLQGSLDMAFGPLAPFITGPATFLATITGIGIATSDLTKEQRKLLGPLADYGDMANNLIGQLDTRFGGMITGIMDGIQGLFAEVDGKPSIFEQMFNRGVDWLGGSGVEITNTMFNMIDTIMESLIEALDKMDTGDTSPLGTFVGNLASRMATVFANGVHIVKPILEEFLRALKGAMESGDLASDFSDIMNTLAGVLKTSISFLWNDIFQPIIVPIIGSIFSMLGNALQGTDSDILQSLGRDISETGTSLQLSGALAETNQSMPGLMSLTEEQFGDWLASNAHNMDARQADELIRLWSIENSGSTSALGRAGQFALGGLLPPGAGFGINKWIDHARGDNVDDTYEYLQGRYTEGLMRTPVEVTRDEISGTVDLMSFLNSATSPYLTQPLEGDMQMFSGQRRSDGSIHAGLDADSATKRVLSQGRGIVTFVDDDPGGTYGRYVRVYYPGPNQLVTYAHLASIADGIAPGVQLNGSGILIGIEGNSGVPEDGGVYGTHLHVDSTTMEGDTPFERYQSALAIGGGKIDENIRTDIEHDQMSQWGWNVFDEGFNNRLSGLTTEQGDQIISLLTELVESDKTRLIMETIQ